MRYFKAVSNFLTSFADLETRKGRFFRTLIFMGFVGLAGTYNFNALVTSEYEEQSHIVVWVVEKITLDSAKSMSLAFDELLKHKEDYDRIISESGASGVGQQGLDSDSTRTLTEKTATESESRLGVFRVAMANGLFVLLYTIFAYVTVYFLCSKHEAQQKWADSLYFFGFILTLMSLILALGSTGRFDGAALSQIVIQNSIALSSTVFALFARTVLTLGLKVDDEDGPESFETLRSQILRTTFALRDLSVQVRGLEDSVSVTRSHVGTIGEVFKAEVDAVAASLRDKAQQIAEIEIDQELIATKMAAATQLALEKVDDEIKALAKTFASSGATVKEKAKLIAGAFDAFTNAIVEGGASSSAALQAVSNDFRAKGEDASMALHELSGTFASRSKTVSIALSGLAEELITGRTTIKGGIDEIKEGLSEGGEAVSERVRDIGDQFEGGASAIRESAAVASGEIEAGGSDMRRSVGIFANEFELGAETVRAGIGRLADKIETEAFADFKARLSAGVESLTASMRDEFAHVSSSVADLTEEIERTKHVTSLNADAINEFRKKTEELRAELTKNQASVAEVTTSFSAMNAALKGTVFEPTWLQSHGQELAAMGNKLETLRTSLDAATAGFMSYARADASRKNSPEDGGSSGNRFWDRLMRLLRWIAGKVKK